MGQWFSRGTVKVGRGLALIASMGLIIAAAVTVVGQTSTTLGAVRLASQTTSAPPTQFVPLSVPVRVLDTRQSGGPISYGHSVTVPVAGTVAAGANAVVLNVTAVDGTAPGYLTAYPTGSVPPLASNVNYVPGPPNCNNVDCVVPNLVTVPLGQGGDVSIFNGPAAAVGSADAVVDVEGYYVPSDTSGTGHYYPQAAQRLADTRCGQPPVPSFCATEGLPNQNATLQTVQAGQTLKVDTSALGAPSGSLGAVVLNVTTTNTTGIGYLTAFPDGAARPTASNANWVAGQTSASRVIVQVGPGSTGIVDLYNGAGSSVDIVVDATGYYSNSAGSPSTGALFVSVPPQRITDTRPMSGQPNAGKTLKAGGNLSVSVTAGERAPVGAVAAAVNLTTVDGTAVSFFSALQRIPSGVPSTSDLNFGPGEVRANADLATLASGSFDVFNYNGSADAVVDLTGYFMPALRSATASISYAWGSNAAGQLGNGTVIDTTNPAAVTAPAGVTFTAMAAGGLHSIALGSDGKIYGWGANTFGQLGNGTTADSLTPVAASVSLPAGQHFTAVAAGGDHSLARTDAGTVYAWGSNMFGQLGNGATGGFNSTPALVGLPSGVTAVAAGGFHSLALASNGAVYAWGANTFGQLGDGATTTSTPTPVQVPSLQASQIAAGGTHSLAVTTSGSIYGWGNNGSGQLGDGTTTNRPLPVAVTPPSGVTFSSVAAGDTHSEALTTAGSVYSWGDNSLGQLGAGNTNTCALDQTALCSAIPVKVFLPPAQTFKAIAAGRGQGYALTSGGAGWAWGSDYYGQLDNGTSSDTPVATPTSMSLPANVNISVLSSGPEASFGLLVTGVDQTISTFPPVTKTYGQPAFYFTPTATSALPVSITASGACRYLGNYLVRILSAGTCTITGTQSGNTFYNPAPPETGTYTIAQAPLTLTANDQTSTVGTIPPLTYTLSGFVNGDTASVVTGQASCSTTATSSSPAGTYPITCSAGSLTAQNYTVNRTVPGTLTLHN